MVKRLFLSSRIPLLILLLQFTVTAVSGQELFFIRVYFKDKGETGSYNASELFSSRAILRREKAGITDVDYRDFPVNSQYINNIKAMGLKLHCTSRWLNTALFGSTDHNSVSILNNLPYVAGTRLVKTPGKKSLFPDKLVINTSIPGQAPFDKPITMLNGYALHDHGFRGENVLIAVLDGGFSSADRIESLSNLRTRKGIIATYDFVNNSTDVYNANTHGTAVLSILAGNLSGKIAGTAPSANYILLKTEDVSSEFPCEEDFWAAGAEYADSAGADIISSSLGYYNFDDPSMDYKHIDLNGNTAIVTIAADIAASKGILVVNSAGNERDNYWQKIIFPSDGDSVLAVGAVDENELISGFSSSGPSSDRRIKPDVSAMGVLVPLQTALGYVTRGSGTSFSCPVISGMSACLLQAVPEATPFDIITALNEGSDRFNTPDSLYGYGIPDMSIALQKLRDKYVLVPEEILIRPNPTTGPFDIVFGNSPGPVEIKILSTTGKLIYSNSLTVVSRILHLDVLQKHEQGLYLIKINGSNGTSIGKIIKLRE
ncbi:MAG TPA: S8 family peptidase [Bacteroidales bacterium]|nr:S8 family peptidase [Bacteroidales bacterium]